MKMFEILNKYFNKIQSIEGHLSLSRHDFFEVYERNLQLEEEIKLRTEELEQANKALLSLQNVWEMMNSSQPLSIIFENIIQGLQHGLDYKFCFLLQKKEIDNEVFFQIKATLNNNDTEKFKKNLSNPLNHYKLHYSKDNEIGVALSENKIKLTKNVKSLVNVLLSNINDNIYDKYEIFTNTKSVIILPLYSNNIQFGVILVFSPREEATENEKTFLNLFVYQTELAITIANLFEEVKKQAVTDALTELYNRRYFLKALEQETERANRTKSPYSVISLDLDNLKKINDTYGHSVGDLAIKSVAKVLKSNARAIDTPSRIGGEEFSVLLPDVNSESALLVAERIRESIEKENVEVLGHITASIGVATYFEHSENMEELLELADQAMYRSKINGRNQVQVAKLKYDTEWQEIAIQAFIEILSKKQIPISEALSRDICMQLNKKMISDATARDLVFATADTISSVYNADVPQGQTKQKVLLAIKLAKKIQLKNEDIDKLRIAILLYDIGKILLPSELLLKKDPLTEEEKEIIKKHPILGVQQILKPISIISDVLPVIENHHEYWNGKGYPNNISENSIPVLSQIVLLVDEYSALIQNRPYRAALSQEEAIDVINKEINIKWSSELVYNFIQVLCIESSIEENMLSY